MRIACVRPAQSADLPAMENQSEKRLAEGGASESIVENAGLFYMRYGQFGNDEPRRIPPHTLCLGAIANASGSR